MSIDKYYCAYEQRYASVYAAGASYWNLHEPSKSLVKFLMKYSLKSGRVLELGCGEGFESRYLARLGFDVTGVDISPTVIEKCRHEATKNGLSIRLEQGDITDLGFLTNDSFDLIVAIGSYHMLYIPEDRAKCLNEARRVLRKGGFIFLQNGLDLKEAKKYFPEEKEDIDAFFRVRIGKEVKRKLLTDKGEKEITVPKMAKTFFGTLGDYVREVSSAGFEVLEAYRTNDDKINAGWEAVIVGHI